MNMPDELAEQAEAARRAVLARRKAEAERISHGRDDWNLIEVGVDGRGEVVEVAVNGNLIGQVRPGELAEAVLQAARAAQRKAREGRTR